MQTMVQHMKRGHDPFTAAAKTMRTRFDYGELTDFERIWMRNLFLFYIWIKKNPLLHASGVVTRPGVAQAFGDIERERDQFDNEPEYFKRLLAIPTPLGPMNVTNPAADIFKFSGRREDLRKNVFGAVHPAFRVPAEIAFNTTAFTGQDVQKYPGERGKTPFDELLGELGIGIAQRDRLGTPTKNRVFDKKITYIMDQLFGPQWNTYMGQQRMEEEDRGGRGAEFAQRFSGLDILEEQEDKWREIRRLLDDKKSAEEDMRYNRQRRPGR